MSWSAFSRKVPDLFLVIWIVKIAELWTLNVTAKFRVSCKFTDVMFRVKKLGVHQTISGKIRKQTKYHINR